MDRPTTPRLLYAQPLVALGLIPLALPVGAQVAWARPSRGFLSDMPARGAHGLHHLGFPSAGLAIEILLLAALAIAAVVGTWRVMGRRYRGPAIACVLALSTAIFTLETAVHSVHHLGDAGSGASCAILSASQALSWAGGEAPDTSPPPPRVSAAPLVRRGETLPSKLYRPHAGRAPPA
jgi:hypothetical protein